MSNSASQLVISADDFGMSVSVNTAVVVAHLKGALTSTSLMVAGDAVEDAVTLAMTYAPKLAVGLHLVCIDGKPTLPPSEIPDLVDERGFFSSNPFMIGAKYFFGRRAQERLRRELRAQFEKFAATGLPLSHVDSHWHFHMHPTIFPMAIELAVEFGAKRLRIPRDDFWGSVRRSRQRLLWKTITALEFAWLNRCAMKWLTTHHSPLTSPDRCHGLFDTGAMDERTFLAALRRSDSGLAEIYFHPDAVSTGASPSGPRELDALLSEEARRFIQEREQAL